MRARYSTDIASEGIDAKQIGRRSNGGVYKGFQFVKTLFIAIALAILPSAAAAQTVVINFSGTADAASYVRTHNGTTNTDSFSYDAGIPTVTGTLTINTAGLVSQPGTSVYYDAGGAAFLSGSFTSTGTTPAVVSGGTPTHYVQADSGTGTIEFDMFNTAAVGTAQPFSSQFTLFGDGVPMKTINGVNLPDFANAANLYFSLISQQGNEFDFIERYSAGTVTSLKLTVQTPTAAVPEPASWAMLILGFGIAGGALRRRPIRFAAA